jgi:hypothetical protein
MCTELLPPGGYTIAVKYIISTSKDKQASQHSMIYTTQKSAVTQALFWKKIRAEVRAIVE